MERDPDVLVMGEDVGGDFGGAFKVTKGLASRFGDDRVLNTPIAELELHRHGERHGPDGSAADRRDAVRRLHLDRLRLDRPVRRHHPLPLGWTVPWVIRAPSDGGIRSGPYHSQNPEAWFVHTPGTEGGGPATPADAKGLLTAAIRDDNPVIFFEAKPLYRSIRGPRPGGRTPGPHRPGGHRA
jgi:pyruvate/2-oxoglutarate/acetoin dehydrogenase E1 component